MTDSLTIPFLAKRKWRGISTPDLALEILELRHKLDTLDTDPDGVINFERPLAFTQEEWILSHRFLYNQQLQDCLKELDRRRTLNDTYIKNPDKEIIQAIKERINLADVMEWYTEITHSNRDQMKFRCTLHGTDTTPSGVIYNKEQKWWCFGCSRGGDAFDAVQAFERIELPEAIKKLANHLGIELRPLKENNKRMGINV